MKTLITILLFASTSQAANFALESEIKSGAVVTVYTDEKYCPSKCYAIDSVDVEVSDLVEVTKPVYEAKSNVTPCEFGRPLGSDPEVPITLCSEVVAVKDFCPKDYEALFALNEDTLKHEAYCTRLLGQEPTGQFELKENAVKKAAKESRVKAAEDAKLAKKKECDDLLKKSGTLTTAELTKIIKTKAEGLCL